MKLIENSYCEYCKYNETALIKSTEYTTNKDNTERMEFFINAQNELKGKTGAWDFSSMLIKPVQRVLKYPLFIKVHFFVCYY